MNILVAIIIFGLLFWKLKNNFISRATLAYEYKLKEIGFKLDMLVVNNKVKVDNSKYKILSNKICNVGANLESFNLLVLFIFFLRDRKNKAELVTKPKLNPYSISKKDQKINVELRKIEKEFNDTVFAYIIKKSVGLKIFVLVFHLGIKPAKRIANTLSAKLRDYLKYYIEIPSYRQTKLSPFAI